MYGYSLEMTSCGCSGSPKKRSKRSKSSKSFKSLYQKRQALKRKSPSVKRMSMKKKSKSRSRRRSKSRSKVRIPVRKEDFLKRYGYGVYESEKVRHSALTQAVQAYGASSVVKKLNVLMIFNKNNHPALSKKFAKDRDWVSKKWIHH
jgi:hypothetical protein